MRIHSRQQFRPGTILKEGLGFDTRVALTGLSDVRDSMKGLLSADGEDRATGADNKVNHIGHNEVSFVLATAQTSLVTPTLQDLVVKNKAVAYGSKNDLISFSDGRQGLLTLRIKGLGGQHYPILNHAYEVTVVGKQTLIPNAPAGPFTWFMLKAFKPKQGPLP